MRVTVVAEQEFNVAFIRRPDGVTVYDTTRPTLTGSGETAEEALEDFKGRALSALDRAHLWLMLADGNNSPSKPKDYIADKLTGM